MHHNVLLAGRYDKQTYIQSLSSNAEILTIRAVLIILRYNDQNVIRTITCHMHHNILLTGRLKIKGHRKESKFWRFEHFWLVYDIITITSYAPLRPCLLYTSPSPRDGLLSRMPSSA